VTEPLVFAIERYEALQAELTKALGAERGTVERERFPDGERGLVVTSSPRNRHAILIGGTVDDRATLELFDLACGLVTQGVNTLSLVIPYFGYSTQERSTKEGEIVTAKARATLLSAVPLARYTNEAVFLDLHTPGIQHYFEGHLHGVHLSAEPSVLAVVKTIAAKNDTVIACTDAGRAKWVQSLANGAGLPAAFVYKSRKGGSVVTTGINADVKDRHVVLYDDMIRSGRSLIQAAEAYKEAGAATITAIATHGLLPGDSLAKVKASGLFDTLYVTDSVPQAKELAKAHGEFLKILPVAPLIAAYVQRTKSAL